MFGHVTSRFLDWREGTADRAPIDRHLRECPACRSYFDRMTRLLDAANADALPSPAPDPFLPGRVAALAAARASIAADAGETMRPFLRWTVFAAAVAVGIVVGISVLPEPGDEDLDDIVVLCTQAVSGEDFSAQLGIVLDETGGQAE